MPSWKKVIISGSAAELSSVFAPSITGSLQGTASFAVTASYALTSSFSLATSANQILGINKSGFTITKGTVVHLTGSTNSSDTPYITTASYESDNLSANTLGIAAETITFNSTGYITTEGVLPGLDVTGFVAGQVVYLGASGSITGSAPIAPLHSVRLGQVVRDSPTNNGSIYVRIDNGYEIGELHDVIDSTTNTSFGALLVKSGSVWNTGKQLTGPYGVTGSFSVKAPGAGGIILDTDINSDTLSSRLFFKISGSGRDISMRNSNGSLFIGHSATALNATGTSTMIISSSGVAIGDNYTISAGRGAALQVSGSINIEEGFAYKQDAENVIRIAKGTSPVTVTYTNTIAGAAAADDVAYLDQLTAFGYNALYQSSGSDQTALGYTAGYQNSGSSQTLVGWGAGYQGKASNQTAVGEAAGWQNTGSSQSAYGYQAGYQNSGSNQTAIGNNAGWKNTATQQTAVGLQAGYLNIGVAQTALGQQAGQSNSGSTQTAVGYASGFQNSGSLQVAIGANAGRDNKGANQTATGYEAGRLNIGANQSVFGYEAGFANTGSNQTAIGVQAGYQNSGSSQTAVGYDAGFQNSGSFQTAVGYSAGYANAGSAQTAYGYQAGTYNSGSNQTTTGFQAGVRNIGNNQTVTGYQAGYENTGSNQSAFGYQAGFENSGSNQVAMGNSAGESNSGNNQTAIGSQAGYLNTGSNQTALGYAAGFRNSGSDNTNIGYAAGTYTTGVIINSQSAQSVFLGSQTTAGGSNRTNQIVIGYNAEGIGSNSVVLGNSSITTTALRGDVGIGTTTPTAKLDIIYSSTSSGVLIRGGGGVLDSTPLKLWDTGTAINNRNIIEFAHNSTYVTASRIYSINPSLNATTGGKLILETTSDNIGTFNTSQLVLSNNGNVGIGTDTPTYTLQIQAAPTASIRLQETGSGGNKRLDLTIDASGVARISANQSAQQIAFDTVNSERIRITNNGNVGIGTTTPTRIFEVVSGSTTAYFDLQSTSGPLAAVVTSDFTKLARFNASDGTNSISVGLRSSAETANPGFGEQNDTYIYANSNANGLNIINASGTGTADYIKFFAGKVATETPSMIIIGSGSSKGNVGIGTTTPLASLHTTGSAIISGSLTVGTGSIGATENTLILGVPPAGGAGEGGQLLLSAAGGTYTTASMIDNYQNKLRFLRGTNAGSDAYKFQLDMHTGQMQLPNYNSSTAFSGTAAGYLAFDSSGNIFTVGGVTATPAGNDTEVQFNNGGALAGTAALRIVNSTVQMSGSTGVTGSLTATNAVIAQANGAMYFRGGDDVELWDINVANTIGIYGQQDATVGSVKLGSGGGTISGQNNRIGIATTTPNATLDVNGDTIITGSFTVTGSYNSPSGNTIDSNALIQAGLLYLSNNF